MSASDNMQENMHTNKLTGEARTYIAPCMQPGCFMFNTRLNMQENMHTNKLTGKTCMYSTAQIQRRTRSRYFSRLALASRSTCVECSSLLPKSSSTLRLQLKLL